jgi:hypothetical protein
MADLSKVVTFTEAGEGSTRTDFNTAITNRTSTSTPGTETTSQINPQKTATTRSRPGKVTNETLEDSPQRTTTETRDAAVNRTVSEASTVTQRQGEQRSETTAREDVGISISFKLKVSDFL